MSSGAFYTKYGQNNAGDNAGVALVKGQQAVNQSFKDAITGVESLLKETEQKYIDENTDIVREELKNRVRAGGLGADAPDPLDIRAEFGKRINLEAIGKTVDSTREKMLTEARDDASVTAGKIFEDTGDIVQANNAFTAKMQEHGAKSGIAQAEGFKWRELNKYRLEDQKIQDDLAIDKASTQTFLAAKESRGDVDLDVITGEVEKDLHPRQADRFREKVKQKADLLGAMSKEQQAEFLHYESLATQEAERDMLKYNQAEQQAQALYNNTVKVPVAASTGSKELGAKLGGMADAINKEFTGTWGGFFSDDLKEGALVNALRLHKNKLSELGITNSDEQDAILFQGVNHATQVGMGDSTNKGVNADALSQSINQSVNNYMVQKQATGMLANAQNAKAAQLQKHKENKERMMYDLTRGAFKSKIHGSNFDPEGVVKSYGYQVPKAPGAGSNLADSSSAEAPTREEYQKRYTKIDGKKYLPDDGKSAENGTRYSNAERHALFNQVEEEIGIPKGYLKALDAGEGSGQNPDSSAYGDFQFIHDTAKEMGITDRTDLQQTSRAAAKYAKQNAQLLQGVLGRAPTAKEMYLGHFLGGEGAALAIANPNGNAAEILGENAVLDNRGTTDMTIAEFIKPHVAGFEKRLAKASGGTPVVNPSSDEIVAKSLSMAGAKPVPKETPQAPANEAASGEAAIKAEVKRPLTSGRDRGDKEAGWAIKEPLRAIAKASAAMNPPEAELSAQADRLADRIRRLPKEERDVAVANAIKNHTELGDYLLKLIEAAQGKKA